MMMDNTDKRVIFNYIMGEPLLGNEDNEKNTELIPSNASISQKIAAASQMEKLKLCFVFAGSISSILLNMLSILTNSSNVCYVTLFLVLISAPFLIKNEIDLIIMPGIRKQYTLIREKYYRLARINEDLKDTRDEIDDKKEQ